jgi:hypothetical protein
LKSTDRKIAVPSVPPIDRKNVTELVATPISRGETAFCTAVIIGCMLRPRPRPIRTMIPITRHSGVSAPISANRPSASTISELPMIGKIR